MRTSKVLSVSLPAEMLLRVANIARAEERTVSELVREAIRRYEKSKELNMVAGQRKSAQGGRPSR